MGVEYRLVLYAGTADTARGAATAVFDRLAALDRTLSDWNDESELMRLCANAGDGNFHAVSDDLLAVLARAREHATRSDGAFDFTVGPLVRLWRAAAKSRRLPDAADLADARRRVGPDLVEIDAAGKRVRLGRPGMRLDLGGIAKGWALDDALRLLRARGVTRALIDGGGDVAAADPPPGEPGWRVALAPLDPDAEPVDCVVVANAAVATSGDAYRHVEIGGVRYSHIVDPRTGLGITVQRAVTVVASDATTADALATAVSVLGAGAGALVERSGAAARVIERRDGVTETTRLGRPFDVVPIDGK